jgi:hypothetical protein
MSDWVFAVDVWGLVPCNACTDSGFRGLAMIELPACLTGVSLSLLAFLANFGANKFLNFS